MFFCCFVPTSQESAGDHADADDGPEPHAIETALVEASHELVSHPFKNEPISIT